MRTLGIDTSSEVASVALLDDAVILAELSARVSAQHGETLLPRIEELLALAKAARASIDLIAVGLGPGSFTGVRIGVATAKGLALGMGRPIVGLRTSEVIAAAVSGEHRVVAIDGKKGEVFASVWRAEGDVLRCVLEDVHGAPEVIAKRIRALLDDAAISVVGTAVAAYPSFVDPLGAAVSVIDEPFPRASVLAGRARSVFLARGPDDLARLEPVYVRGADALLPAART